MKLWRTGIKHSGIRAPSNSGKTDGAATSSDFGTETATLIRWHKAHSSEVTCTPHTVSWQKHAYFATINAYHIKGLPSGCDGIKRTVQKSTHGHTADTVLRWHKAQCSRIPRTPNTREALALANRDTVRRTPFPDQSHQRLRL